MNINDRLISDDVEAWGKASLTRGALVLDLGCGTSPYVKALERYGATMIGIDIESRGSGPAVYGKATALPIKDSAVDGVLATELFEHLPDPQILLTEIHRVLKPGGAVLLTCPLFYMIHEAPHDFMRPTEFGLRTIFERSGFQVGLVRRRGGLGGVVTMLLGQVLIGLASLPNHAPIIGPIYRATAFKILQLLVQGVEIGYVLLVRRSKVREVRLDDLKGLQRVLASWTLGYAIIGTKQE